MIISRIVSTALGGFIALGALTGVPSVAKADTASTAAIIAGAAAIVGALLIDNNSGRSYYVRGNQRHYVSHDTAMYYRQHHGNGNNGNRGNGNYGNRGNGNGNHDNNGNNGNNGHQNNHGNNGQDHR